MQQPWTALRLWINEQEDAELRTGRPAPLTLAQRDAIDVLVPGASAASSVSVGPASPGLAPALGPSGVFVDPDYDRVPNWVSSLNEYTQLNNHPPPEVEYISRELAPRTPVKWEAVCTVPGIGATFPSAEYGFLGGQAPWFSTKKDAKRYVSMCAMRYMSDLVTARSQSQAPTTPEKMLVEVTNGARAPRVASMSPSSDGDPVASQSSRKKAGLGSGGGGGEDEPDASVQIVSVCRRLGLTTPRTEVTPHDTHGYFDARAVFPDSFPAAVPPDLGVVTGVLTKRAAKEASAQRVLDWLRELERERDADLAGILSQGRF